MSTGLQGNAALLTGDSIVIRRSTALRFAAEGEAAYDAMAGNDDGVGCWERLPYR